MGEVEIDTVHLIFSGLVDDPKHRDFSCIECVPVAKRLKAKLDHWIFFYLKVGIRLELIDLLRMYHHSEVNQ